MGTFSRRSTSSVQDIDLDMTGLIECKHEPTLEGALALVVEAEENYTNIVMVMGEAELAVFESTGMEMVYESGAMSAFFDKVKQFILNVWEKIKGIFKKFFGMIDQYVKSDKEFVNKYKGRILSANAKDFKYKGYKFTVDTVSVKDASTKMEGIIVDKTFNLGGKPDPSQYEDTIKNLQEKDDIYEKLMSVALGSSSSLTRAEFIKELHAKLRSGEEAKEEFDNVDASDILIQITETSQITKDAKKAYKETEDAIKKLIKDLNNTEKETLKASPKKDSDGKYNSNATKDNSQLIQCVHGQVDLLREEINILQTINGAILSAIKDRNRQARAVGAALASYSPKNESSIYDNSGVVGESFLSSVVLK